MSFKWYVNRLRSMPPQELIHRVVEKAKKTVSSKKNYDWTDFDDARLNHTTKLKASLVRNSTQISAAALAQYAQRLLDGEFKALGVTWPPRPTGRYDEKIWKLDPVSKKTWYSGNAYTFNINYRHRNDIGDIKYIWEFHRLQFLVPLAAQYVLTRDPLCLSEIDACISSWYANNPPFTGVGWNSGIEVALRGISLSIVFLLIGDVVSDTTKSTLARIISAHSYWARRFPSAYSSANNHLIAEAAGIFIMSLVAPSKNGSSAHHALNAKKILEDEASKQIYRDGVGAEQSPSYGAFSAEMLLVASKIGEMYDMEMAASIDERLNSLAGFIRWISTEKSECPAIGDDDEGRVIVQLNDDADYPSAIARAISGPTKYEQENLPPELREMLFGTPEAAAEVPHGSKVFADGGYSVCRSNVSNRKVALLIDHGPLGYLGIAAHGHSDALSVLLSVNGVPVFSDAGTYLYHSGGDWREWFRSTAAHNTLQVEGASQSISSGHFNWAAKANSKLLKFEDGPWPSIIAEHDGYQKRFGIILRREIKTSETEIRISDSILGNKNKKITSRFLIDPRVDVEKSQDGICISNSEFGLAKLDFSGVSNGKEISVQSEIIDTWISRRFGTKNPAKQIVVSSEHKIETMITLIRFGDNK